MRLHLLLLPFLIFTLTPIVWVLKMAFSDQQSFDLNLSLLPSTVSVINLSQRIVDQIGRAHV